MSDGSQFIDIVLFAMVAVFLGLRLRSALGKRTGNEPPPGVFRGGPPPGPAAAPAGRDNVIDLVANRAPAAETFPPGSIEARLAAITAGDETFTGERFKAGAGGAFEMIVRAFAGDDEATLRPLLADEVFENFTHAIRARKESGEVCQNQLVRIKSLDIADVQMEGSTARITVKYVTEQIIVVKNSDGAVVEGDPSRSVEITDVWTFARDLRSRNPNWLLVATSSPDA